MDSTFNVKGDRDICQVIAMNLKTKEKYKIDLYMFQTVCENKVNCKGLCSIFQHDILICCVGIYCRFACSTLYSLSSVRRITNLKHFL